MAVLPASWRVRRWGDKLLGQVDFTFKGQKTTEKQDWCTWWVLQPRVNRKEICMSSINRAPRPKLGEILIDMGLVTEEQIQQALGVQETTKETLSSIMVDMGCLSDSDFTRTLVMEYQLPYIILENYELDEELANLLCPEFLHSNKLLPFDRIGDTLLCAVTELPREEILEEITRQTGCKTGLYAASLSEVDRFLDHLAPLKQAAAAEPVDQG